MKNVYRITAIVFGINMLLVVLILVNQNAEGNFISIGLLWLFGLLAQVILGLVFVFVDRLRETGKGLLLGALFGLVIGFSVCSTMLR